MIFSVPRLSRLILALAVLAPASAHAASIQGKNAPATELSMDQMWGATTVLPGLESSDRFALFRDGNYGMFIHWGIYSHLGGQWKGQTFYGIGEWIKRQMKISEPDYMAEAKNFNPTVFDAREIVRVAKAAGMKWIIITSKHHDGFAMFKSAHPFNIVDASPFARDPMKELATATREAGLGFGFYYSHNQDWTASGGNNGPKQNADGTPASFDQYFREKCYPQVVYAAGPSPWDHAQPWGDVTTSGNTLNLVVFDWPAQGRLMLPGLQNEIAAAGVVSDGKLLPVTWKKRGTWTELQLPPTPPDHPASVIAVKLRAAPQVDQTLGVHPNLPTSLLVEFAEVKDAIKEEIRWMEKFGEWKAANQVSAWKPSGRAVWTVNVAEAGDYRLDLKYKGEGRLVWHIETDEGLTLQNQQNSSPIYQSHAFGLLTFKTPGQHTLAVSLVDGSRDKASLQAIRLSPVQ